jgi:hypothetical protein
VRLPKVNVGDVVLIGWADHYTAMGSWQRLSAAKGKSNATYENMSAGVVVDQNAHQLIIAQSWSNVGWDDAQKISDCLILIKSAITKLKIIKRKVF